MALSISTKLKIKSGDSLLAINAPANFVKNLGALPTGASVVTNSKNYQQVHWFVMNKTQLEKELAKIMKLLKDNVVIWVYYPKQSSTLQTDLTRDKGWDVLLSHDDKLTWISLVSFDETWSVFGFRLKTDADKKKQANKAPREIFNWVNPSTKEVKLPDELAAAFRKHKTATGYFNTLSFTNKKEYIEWIVTAKRIETKTERIKGTIERLNKGWKNPSNR